MPLTESLTPRAMGTPEHLILTLLLGLRTLMNEALQRALLTKTLGFSRLPRPSPTATPVYPVGLSPKGPVEPAHTRSPRRSALHFIALHIPQASLVFLVGIPKQIGPLTPVRPFVRAIASLFIASLVHGPPKLVRQSLLKANAVPLPITPYAMEMEVAIPESTLIRLEILQQ